MKLALAFMVLIALAHAKGGARGKKHGGHKMKKEIAKMLCGTDKDCKQQVKAVWEEVKPEKKKCRKMKEIEEKKKCFMNVHVATCKKLPGLDAAKCEGLPEYTKENCPMPSKPHKKMSKEEKKEHKKGMLKCLRGFFKPSETVVG